MTALSGTIHRLSCRYFLLFALALYMVALGASCGQPGRFAGMKMVYMAGGNEDHFFARILARGARDAASDMGIDLTVLWSNWNKEQILLDFKQAISMNPAAICVVGYPGDEALKSFVAEARRKGIVVTSHNVDLPLLEQEYSSNGFGYVGQSVAGSGTKLAREAIWKSGVTNTSKIVVYGVPGIPGRGVRTKAIMAELDRQGLPHTLHDCSRFNSDPKGLEAYLSEAFTGEGTQDLIFDDVLPAVFSAWMEKNGIDPQASYCAAFDISTSNFAALEKGYFDLLLDQQPYLQGYLPVLNAALAVRYGFSGLHILTDASLLDRGNLELVRPWMKEGIR